MANFFGFSSDKMNVYLLLIDSSGSMAEDEENVIKGLKLYQESFEGFSETNSIVVSVSRFNHHLFLSEFQPVSEFKVNYSADGGTALHYSIVTAAKYLMQYVKELTELKKCSPIVTFILFSDGHPSNCDTKSWRDGKEAVEWLNYSGVTTAFVAFGDSITSEFGKKMGFQSTIDVDKSDTLLKFFGEDLSRLSKEQSKSRKSLGSNFFSQIKGKTEQYSHTTEQALEDDDWISCI